MLKTKQDMVSVLIIDDAKLISIRMKEFISQLPGIERVYQANSAETAYPILQRVHPEIVIIDIALPEISGVEILKTIKKEYPEMVAIMFTNYPYPHLRKKCLELGADYFFDKSGEFNKMIETVEKCV